MKVESLTDAQKSRFAEFVDKWTKIGLSTEPANRQKAEDGLRLIYSAANLHPPKIVWCSSPLANGLSRAIVLEKVGNSVWNSVRDSVRDSVGNSVGDSVGDSVWNSVRDSVWNSVRDSVGNSVWNSVWNSVRDSVGNSVWNPVGDSVWNSVWNSVRDSVGNSVYCSGYGQHDASWLAFYDYFACVCNLTKKTEKIKGHWLQAQNAGWYLPYKNICWVAERHNILKLNSRGRLHCENGMALSYPDGWGIYALNGVRMKPKYVLTPAGKLSPETILKEQNVDIRRELIRKVGILNLKDKGKILQEVGEYKLIDMSPFLVGVRYAPHLLMPNHSMEDTWHLEAVHPSCQTIEQSINWRATAIDKNIVWKPEKLN